MSKLDELNRTRMAEGKKLLEVMPPHLAETIQEHKDAAILLLKWANSWTPYGDSKSAEYMRQARRHVEAAELLQRLEDLHR